MMDHVTKRRLTGLDRGIRTRLDQTDFSAVRFQILGLDRSTVS
jgi:hypothetical protein